MVHYLRRLPILCLVSAFAMHAMEKEESPMPLDPNNTQWIRDRKELYLRAGIPAKLKAMPTNQVKEKINEEKREINFLSEYLVSPNPELSKESIEQSLERTRSRLLTFNALYEIRQDEERKAAAAAQRSLKNIFIPPVRKKGLVETISEETNTNNIDELKKHFDTHTKLKQEALDAGDSYTASNHHGFAVYFENEIKKIKRETKERDDSIIFPGTHTPLNDSVRGETKRTWHKKSNVDLLQIVQKKNHILSLIRDTEKEASEKQNALMKKGIEENSKRLEEYRSALSNVLSRSYTSGGTSDSSDSDGEKIYKDENDDVLKALCEGSKIKRDDIDLFDTDGPELETDPIMLRAFPTEEFADPVEKYHYPYVVSELPSVRKGWMERYAEFRIPLEHQKKMVLMNQELFGDATKERIQVLDKEIEELTTGYAYELVRIGGSISIYDKFDRVIKPNPENQPVHFIAEDEDYDTVITAVEDEERKLNNFYLINYPLQPQITQRNFEL